MKKIQIGARIKNAWEYKRTALLWTVLIVLVFLVLSLLFLRFADAYFTSDAFGSMMSGDGTSNDAIYVLLDDYVLMSFLLLLYAFCGFAFLVQLWNDDVADYYILLLLWSLAFYGIYALDLFNPGGGPLQYMVHSLADTLYQLSSIPLLLCIYIRTRRYRGFVRSVLVIEYVVCTLYALLSVTGLIPVVLHYLGFFSDLLLCCALAGILVLGYAEAKQGNEFYSLFCPLISVMVVGMLVITLIAVLGDGSGFYMQRKAFFDLVEHHSLRALREYYLQKFVLLSLFIVLFVRLMTDLMHNKSIIRVLSYEKETAQGYAAAVRERIDEVRRVKHDTMLHINVCSMLHAQGEYQRLGEYLQNLQTEGQTIAPLQYSNNLMIDYLVMSFSRKAEQKQISLQTDIAVLPELSIPDSDLCSLLNNVLQNAFDACAKLQDASGRWVRLEIRADENKIYFTCINSCDGFFIMENGRYLTTKQDGTSHGYGMGIIGDLCRNNGGAMAVQANGDRFTIKVALPYHAVGDEKGNDK
jgi:hypothetical protein